MNHPLLQSALREMQAIYTSPVRLTAMAIAVALLTLSGPFGTLEYDTPTRLVYWAVVVILTYVVGHVVGALTNRAIKATITVVPLRIFLVSLTASLPTSVIVIVATWITEPDNTVGPMTLWFYTFAVTVAVISAITALDYTRETPEPAKDPEGPALMTRLPLQKRGRLLHLEVADHYVEVTTDKGKTMLLMRLSDAIKETAPIKGLQVHRSHWVALDAVERGFRQGGRPVLALEDGAIVPVSRSFMDAARSAGLLG